MKKKNPLLPLLALVVLAATAPAQIVFNSPTGTETITFDGNVANVIRFVPPITEAGVVGLAESDYWGISYENGRFLFISNGVTGQWPGQISGFSNPFTADLNNNGHTDQRFDNFQMSPADSPAGGVGDYALRFDSGTWADKGYLLKIVNNSGVAISEWSLALDTWFDDNSSGSSTIRLAWATTYSAFDNPSGNELALSAGWTEVGSRTSTNSGAGMSSMATIGGSFTASVADGGSLYVAFLYDQSGAGNAFYIDNLSITAVPEPTAAATLLLGLGALFFTRRRQRA